MTPEDNRGHFFLSSLSRTPNEPSGVARSLDSKPPVEIQASLPAPYIQKDPSISGVFLYVFIHRAYDLPRRQHPFSLDSLWEILPET